MLTKTNRAAKKLYRPGAYAKARWGAAAMGASRRERLHLRHHAVVAAAANKPGICEYVAYLLEYPKNPDPVAEITADVLVQWKELWEGSTQD